MKIVYTVNSKKKIVHVKDSNAGLILIKSKTFHIDDKDFNTIY